MTCPLCEKLLRDATTIFECLHTFCRKCIFEKLTDEEVDCCPICNIDLGCIPAEKLRPDHSLQFVRAKIFPFKRRRVNAPPITLPVVRRKERSLSSFVVNMPRQSGLTGRRTEVMTRRASNLRGLNPLTDEPIKKEGTNVEDHIENSSSPETLTKMTQNKRQSFNVKPTNHTSNKDLENGGLVSTAVATEATLAPAATEPVQTSLLTATAASGSAGNLVMYANSTIVTTSFLQKEAATIVAAASSFDLPSPSIEDIKEQFVRSLIRSFYLILEKCLNLVLQGIRTPFSSLKRILTNALDNIEEMGGPERVEPLRQLVTDFEQDVVHWRNLSTSELTPEIENEMAQLTSEIEQAREQAFLQVESLTGRLANVRVQQGEVA